MKQIAILLAGLFAFSGMLHAYDGGENVLMVNLAGTLVGIPTLTYERELSDQASITITLASAAFEDFDEDEDGEELDMFEIHFGGRYYYSSLMDAIHGGFVYGLIGGGNGTYQQNENAEEETINGSIIGGGWGYKGIWDNGFVQEFTAGISVVAVSKSDVGYAGSGPAITWSLGFTF